MCPSTLHIRLCYWSTQSKKRKTFNTLGIILKHSSFDIKFSTFFLSRSVSSCTSSAKQIHTSSGTLHAWTKRAVINNAYQFQKSQEVVSRCVYRQTRLSHYFRRFVWHTAIMACCSCKAISGYLWSSAHHYWLNKRKSVTRWRAQFFFSLFFSCYSFHVIHSKWDPNLHFSWDGVAAAYPWAQAQDHFVLAEGAFGNYCGNYVKEEIKFSLAQLANLSN